MSENQANPVGRPTSYLPTYNDQAYKLALLGATDKEIADFFDVCEATVNNWKIEHPEFLESIKDGKTKADYSVAHKLYDKAIGAEWIEEQAFKLKESHYDENGKKCEEEKVVIVPVKRAAPPDTKAIEIWLRNRSAKWKLPTELPALPNQTVNLIVVHQDKQNGHTITLTPEAISSVPVESN